MLAIIAQLTDLEGSIGAENAEENHCLLRKAAAQSLFNPAGGGFKATLGNWIYLHRKNLSQVFTRISSYDRERRFPIAQNGHFFRDS